jgi:methylated-DNA-[protein]-cysteine S-methyltransferase
MTVQDGSRAAIHWCSFETPMGRVFAASGIGGLCRLTWQVAGPEAFEVDLRERFPAHDIIHDEDSGAAVRREIGEYFSGRRHAFDIGVDIVTLSAFERAVLNETLCVPYGSTVTYGELARRIGRPGGARAVGNALRKNPIALVIPCHRVVRADGSPGGYGGPSGTPEKVRLLSLELNA